MSNGKRLYHDIFQKMLALIDSGEFPVGVRLPPERDLAERFGVSRPTIREAIIALEALDRVSVKVGSGVYVLDHYSSRDHVYKTISPFELTEARALIEGEAVALAANMITQEELEQLEQTLEDMARENEAGNLAAGDADREFHHLIAQASRNKTMILISDQLWHIRNHAPQVYKAYKAICEQNGRKRIDEHRAIYEALSLHDAEAARSAMHEHFARIVDKLIVTEETKKFDEIRQRSDEVRKRFSLDHLVGTQ